jgi:DNA-binding transcriptional MerR regulator
MKPQQLAALLHISPATLRKWASEEFGEFLSPAGQGGNGAKRSFNDRDARIMAWISSMKAQNVPQKDIILSLKSFESENWQSLPSLPHGTANGEPIAVVPREAVEERLQALSDRYEAQLIAIKNERNQLQTQLETKQRELDIKQRELESARREATELLREQQKETTSTISSLQQKITELSTKEAELRGRLEQYSIGGRRVSAVTMIIAALIVGVLVTAIVILVASQISGPR